MKIKNNPITIAILLMITSVFAFSFMQIFISKSAPTIPIFEQLFFRNLLIAIMSFIFMKKHNIPIYKDNANLKTLLLRAIFGLFSMAGLFYASANAHQSDVATITKMGPFLVVVFAAIFLKEKLNTYKIISLIIATIGVFIISGANFNSNLFTLLMALSSTVFGGIAHLCVSFLKGKENPWSIIVIFSLFSCISTLPLALYNFVLPTWREWFLLIMIGVCAGIGQLTLTYSYSMAKASVVSIYNYFGIIFSAILGFIFLGENITIYSILGSAFVMLGGFIMYIKNKE